VTYYEIHWCFIVHLRGLKSSHDETTSSCSEGRVAYLFAREMCGFQHSRLDTVAGDMV
jgi:hypothetical protein